MALESRWRAMLPTLITLLRIVLVFVTVPLFGRGYVAALVAVGLTIVVIWMDALDGWVARRTGQSSDMGALLDITGDRIVENVFWIYFATAGAVSFWVPIVVITRGFLTDTVRTLQFERGKTPFGDKTMMRSAWSRFLVAGRFMRGLYGGAKVAAFVALGVVLAFQQGLDEGRLPARVAAWDGILEIVAHSLVLLTVFLCVVRGLPVLWDGRDLFLRPSLPRSPD
jgi:CDP-diacylglycerol---glycerol-3-phosphate 3-phosphatidyltransferase